MSRVKRPVLLLLAAVMITLAGGLCVSCAATQEADVFSQVRRTARPYKFSIAAWELQRLFSSS